MTRKYAFGWKKGPEDPNALKYKPLLRLAAPPPAVDLEPDMPAVYDQMDLGSCTAQAGSALAQFLMRRHNLPEYLPSRLAIYYWTRQLMGTVGEDSGASLTDTMRTLNNKGVPGESLWWYNTAKFAVKPNRGVAADGLRHQLLQGMTVQQDPSQLMTCLAEGNPVMFGFLVFESFMSAGVAATGIAPMPRPGEEVLGGHAVCFTGDTKVSLMDGRELSFVELVEQYADKNFWVYSCDKEGNVKPGRAHSPRKTGNQRRILKVVLDNGEEIKCTEDHEFLMRDGSYKMAKHLLPNDSLMPLYRKKSTQKHMKDYEMFLNPSDEKWYYTHRKNAPIKFDGIKTVVHHKNFNKHDNRPENLERMPWEEHTRLHAQHQVLLTEYAKSEEGRRKSRELMQKLWSDNEWREKSLKRAKNNGIKVTKQRKKDGIDYWPGLTKEKRSEIARINGLNNIKKTHNEESRRKGAATRKEKFQKDELYREKAISAAKNNIKEYNQKIKTGEMEINEKQREARRQHAIRLIYKRFFSKKYSSFEEYLVARNSGKEKINHKVVKVEFSGIEDVYDLTVESYHNFALSAGVFVHNCLVGYDLSRRMFKARNSWSSRWGQAGYFWLPYDFVSNRQWAADFWTATGFSVYTDDACGPACPCVCHGPG